MNGDSPDPRGERSDGVPDRPAGAEVPERPSVLFLIVVWATILYVGYRLVQFLVRVVEWLT